MDEQWYDRLYAGIDLDAVRFNMESMHKHIREGTKITAVVKADAYGHGALRIAEVIEPLPYLWGFAVATVDEAKSLIKDGRKKPILILGIPFQESYPYIVEHQIRPAVCDFSMAKELSDIAVRKNKVCHVHIKIDTGMSRIGFLVNENSAEIIARIAALPNIDIEGIFTHFARADEADKGYAKRQLSLFQDFLSLIKESCGREIPIKHCANSAGIMELPEASMDAVRAGIALYGLWPSGQMKRDRIPLIPALSLYSRIVYVKEIEAGTAVSYGGTFVARKKMRIATIPAGYADGYPRGLSGKGFVLIHGKKAGILGRICMDQFMVDVTDIPKAREGDIVTLIGRDGDEQITMEQAGELSGRFNYEFACCLGSRVPRYYRKGGLICGQDYQNF